MYLDNKQPFGLPQNLKEQILVDKFKMLHHKHFKNCQEYENYVTNNNITIENLNLLEDFPFLAVSLFKLLDMKSITDEDIYKIIRSSGTTGQTPSKIFLDRQTAIDQKETLISIVKNFIGEKRLPMGIIDSEATIKKRNNYSARTAGILGFSTFGKSRSFFLKDDLELDPSMVDKFLKDNHGNTVFLFGFTYLIYNNFIKECIRKRLCFSNTNAVLIHGGGWKKLESEGISNESFKEECQKIGIKRVHDYYGMVEQTGSIYLECQNGYFHASNYSDIIIRDQDKLTPLELGNVGLVQLLSICTDSYPGYSILTDDLGYIKGIDNCECGRFGKYFRIKGRIKNAEIRGCSDTL